MTVNTQKSIENKAGLTVGDLRTFLVTLDAIEAMPDDALLVGRVSFGGKMRRLEVSSGKRKQSPPRSDPGTFPGSPA